MKSDYAGKIKNDGTQFVQAPINGTSPEKGTRAIRGEDLRNGPEKSGK